MLCYVRVVELETRWIRRVACFRSGAQEAADGLGVDQQQGAGIDGLDAQPASPVMRANSDPDEAAEPDVDRRRRSKSRCRYLV